MSEKPVITGHHNVSRTWATFRVWGKHLEPEQITRLLGIIPTRAFKAGDKRGQSGIWKHGYWGITSQDNIDSRDLGVHLEWLLGQLEPKQAEVVELTHKPDIKADVFCFWELEAVNVGIEFSPEFMGRMARLNLKLGLDTYFAF